VDQRKANAILELVASGQTLSEACRQPNMPSRSTIYAWLDSDQDFAQRFERALERGGDAIADYAHHIATSTTKENASANRVILDALRWRASRLNARYAPPSGADGASDDDVPRVDVEAARSRLLSRFDEIAERIEGFDRDHHFASGLIAAALRRLEDGRQIDVLLEEDRAVLLEVVRRAISPPGSSQNSEADVAEHNSVNGEFTIVNGDVPSVPLAR
jgi:hypothetical protein